jgi:hypothetical protein
MPSRLDRATMDVELEVAFNAGDEAAGGGCKNGQPIDGS